MKEMIQMDSDSDIILNFILKSVDITQKVYKLHSKN